jgi:hypothetical protein
MTPDHDHPGCCTEGIRIGGTYGLVVTPEGTVPVQRCDECDRYEGDEAAAQALAQQWGTTWGYTPSEDEATIPGDYWVTAP